MQNNTPTDTNGQGIFDLAAFARRTVMHGIDAAKTPSDKKSRIMLARQCGFLSDAETEEWIVLADLEGA